MSMPHFNVLHWAAEPEYRILMSYYCEKNGLTYKWAANMRMLREALRESTFDVYVLDPSDRNALAFGPLRSVVELIRARHANAHIVLYAPGSLEHVAHEYDIRSVSRSEMLEDQFVPVLRMQIGQTQN